MPARKPGKLPRETFSASYALEYGSDELHIHTDALEAGDRVIIVDDLFATGGTAIAQIELVEKFGAKLVGLACLMELEFLHPREAIAARADVDVFSMVQVG